MLPPWERERDKCLEHLLVQPGAREGTPAVRPTAFHGDRYDQAAEWLQERKGMIPVAEYRRRVLEAAKSENDPLLSRAACWRKPLSLELAAKARTVLARLADEAQGAVRLDGVGVDEGPLVTVQVRDACAGDLVLGVARLAGWVVLPGQDGSLAIAAPQGPREQFRQALPLPLWAAVAITPVERDLARSDAAQRFWRSLTTETRDSLLAQRGAMRDLPPDVRQPLKEMVCLDAAKRLSPWLLNLPDRASRVLLCLYESEELGYFELAAPTVSEVVQGFQYLLLKAELTGQPALIRKIDPSRRKAGEVK